MRRKFSELVNHFTVPAFVLEVSRQQIIAANMPFRNCYGKFLNRQVKLELPEPVADKFFLNLTSGDAVLQLHPAPPEEAEFQALIFPEGLGLVFRHYLAPSSQPAEGRVATGNTPCFHLNYLYHLASGKRTFAEPEQLQHLGLAPADLPPEKFDWRAIIPPEDQPTYDAALTELTASGGSRELSYRVRRLDGSICPVRDYCGVATPANQWPVLTGAIVCDCRLEEYVAQAGKQVLAGRMLGGMIHDFKNLLGGIRNIVEWTASIASDRRVCDALKKTLVYTDHATEMITGTLRLNQTEANPTSEYLDAGREIMEMEGLVGKIIPASITMNIIIADQIPLIYGPKSLFKNMLLNLCVNARDAMKKHGGTLTIKVGRADTSADHAAGHVILSVSDDGCGMTPQEVNQVFDAFYSTKTCGTGLGMWMVRNAVNAFCGHIEIDSRVGCGTTVRVM
ncbi:MAG: PAS domain-containing sensor histidine kinase, partial [Victivallales bacterium]|nr:PAS domain-containing sensor histidine kinase [Victivallales bacterium]